MNGKIGQPEWIALLDDFAAKGNLIRAVFSSPRRKDPDVPRKLSVRPVSLKSGPAYQFERLQNNKAFHENVGAAELRERLASAMEHFKQALFKTDEAEIRVLANRRGELAVASRSVAAKRVAPQPHNRSKSHVLPEGEPVPFLVALGVMTSEGKVVKAKYDKFRQINRFLETVADIVSELPRGKRLKIVDFGCGKSYLTFALYHYLALKSGLPVRIIGLDLKQDVVEACAGLAADLGWDDLTFAVGDIAAYEGDAEVDMVVTLHACDTATDAALLKAIGWNAGVILSVPCCQHELFGQISQPVLQPLLKHGILKERFAALVTDAVRANLLELAGYRTRLLEFIDPEHTPKNILIRAVKGRKTDNLEQLRREYDEFRDFLSISPYMEK
ncbi:class I SAM-dependent methyltransferase [Paenibacillaceae bacterium WGS1546]|uniref:class I SAM-dependent methyltransferase n=1 Tax=Cohnella sp. WGS1546 TaxID=3366810 RepID=UPI00372CFCB5